MKIFDTHAHYDDKSFDEDRHQLIEKLLKNSIDCIINVGADFNGCEKSVSLTDVYDNVYAAVGIHPDDVVNLNEDRMKWIENTVVNNKKVVAVGEIGLDYHYLEPSKEIQKKWFKKQLEMAVKIKMPVIIHSREACEDTLDIIKQTNADSIGGVIHCYSYSKESVREFYDLGFYFGFGGVVTFKNAKKAIAAVQEIPMDRILLETDCPYMCPEPFRGKRNNSQMIQYVAEKIADIKGITSQEVIDITNANARKLFRL